MIGRRILLREVMRNPLGPFICLWKTAIDWGSIWSTISLALCVFAVAVNAPKVADKPVFASVYQGSKEGWSWHLLLPVFRLPGRLAKTIIGPDAG